MALNGQLLHITKPDTDNLTKFLFDNMSGIIFPDDRQIVRETAEKRYGTQARTEIEIEEITSMDVEQANRIIDAIEKISDGMVIITDEIKHQQSERRKDKELEEESGACTYLSKTEVEVLNRIRDTKRNSRI